MRSGSTISRDGSYGFTAPPSASGYLSQVHQPYRCAAMHHFEPALVVHSNVPIRLKDRKLFPWLRRRTRQHTVSQLLLGLTRNQSGKAVALIDVFVEDEQQARVVPCTYCLDRKRDVCKRFHHTANQASD